MKGALELQAADIEQALTRLRTAFEKHPQLAIWTKPTGPRRVRFYWRDAVSPASGTLAKTEHYIAVGMAVLEQLQSLRQTQRERMAA